MIVLNLIGAGVLVALAALGLREVLKFLTKNISEEGDEG